MKWFGIDSASPSVPLESRLQVLAVSCQLFCMTTLGPGCIVLFFYLLFYTQFYWIVLIYAAIYVIQGRPDRRSRPASNWARRWPLWCYYRDYFPVKLIKTSELPPSKNYILAVYPHGIGATGGVCFFTEALNVSQVFPGIRPVVLTLGMFFNMPGIREIAQAVDGYPASKESLDYLLSDPNGGTAAVLVPGGSQEALLSKPGNVDIVLKKRKGFVKSALKNGASLVPVFSFGENELYDQVDNPEGSWLRWAQEQFKHITRISPPLLIGRGYFQDTFGLLPRRKPVNVVDKLAKNTFDYRPIDGLIPGEYTGIKKQIKFTLCSSFGEPIEVVKNLAPTDEQIDELHQCFQTALVDLFEREKHKYLIDPKNTNLIIH